MKLKFIIYTLLLFSPLTFGDEESGDANTSGASPTESNQATESLPEGALEFPGLKDWHFATDESDNQQIATKKCALIERGDKFILPSLFLFVDENFDLMNRELIHEVAWQANRNFQEACDLSMVPRIAQMRVAISRSENQANWIDHRAQAAKYVYCSTYLHLRHEVCGQGYLNGPVEAEKIARRKAEREARLAQAQNTQQTITKERSEQVQTFLTTHGVSEVISDRELNADPAKYEGKVVAFPSAFYRMIGNNEGLFRLDEYVIASNISSAAPTSRTGTLIAMKIKGTREFKTGLGERTMPYGDFLSSLTCESRGCVMELGSLETGK